MNPDSPKIFDLSSRKETRIAGYFKKQVQKPSSDIPSVLLRPKSISRKDSGVNAASKKLVRPRAPGESNLGSTSLNTHHGASLLSESDSSSTHVNQAAPSIDPALSQDEETYIVYPTSLPSTVPVSASELEDKYCQDQPPTFFMQAA